MKDYIIASPVLTVHVNPCGAELKGIAKDGLEYLWQGDADSYARTSPTLFPIVGRFLSDTYFVGDQPYQMPPSGIVQNRNFTVEHHQADSIVLCTQSDEKTLRQYPYAFRLTVSFHVSGNRVTISQQVENSGDTPLPFILGCHTAYRWPLYAHEQPTDYFLRFAQPETLESFNPFGWRDSFVQNSDIRPLDHTLFVNFTRSVTGLQSPWIELANQNNHHKVRIYREQYSYLALWAKPESHAPFLCMEPCTGVQPGNKGSLTLFDREGVQVLVPGESSRKSFIIEID